MAPSCHRKINSSMIYYRIESPESETIVIELRKVWDDLL